MAWNTDGNVAAARDFLGTTNNEPLVVKTDNLERVRVLAAGNVGIGTINPGKVLEVAAADDNTGVKITGTDSNRSWLISVGIAPGDGKLNIYDFGAAATRLAIDTNGNIGVGTANPAYPLHMPAGKALRIEGGTNANDQANYFSFGGNGAFAIDAPGVPNGRFVVQNSGNVGIGIPNPGQQLEVAGNVWVGGSMSVGEGSVTSCLAIAGQSMETSSYPGACPSITLTNTVPYPQANQIYPPAASVDFNTFPPDFRRAEDYSPSSSIRALDSGNFANDIVFLSNQPGAPCNGLVEQMRITSTGNINVPGDIILTGADCAEQFDIIETDRPEPGTVVVIDEGGSLRESRDPYDKKVAGVVSGAGEYRHGILLDGSRDSNARVPVALLGKVYCKVDAQSSPIKIGDLLTTSSTPGHAMKATDARLAFGAVLGKALKPLAAGTGLIPILVALQ